MTNTVRTDAAQIAPVFTQTMSRSRQGVDQRPYAPFEVQTVGTAHPNLPLPDLALVADELRRLQQQCAAQARRLDELEAREHLSWPTRSAYAHLEIDP